VRLLNARANTSSAAEGLQCMALAAACMLHTAGHVTCAVAHYRVPAPSRLFFCSSFVSTHLVTCQECWLGGGQCETAAASGGRPAGTQKSGSRSGMRCSRPRCSSTARRAPCAAATYAPCRWPSTMPLAIYHGAWRSCARLHTAAGGSAESAANLSGAHSELVTVMSPDQATRWRWCGPRGRRRPLPRNASARRCMRSGTSRRLRRARPRRRDAPPCCGCGRT